MHSFRKFLSAIVDECRGPWMIGSGVLILVHEVRMYTPIQPPSHYPSWKSYAGAIAWDMLTELTIGFAMNSIYDGMCYIINRNSNPLRIEIVEASHTAEAPPQSQTHQPLNSNPIPATPYTIEIPTSETTPPLSAPQAQETQSNSAPQTEATPWQTVRLPGGVICGYAPHEVIERLAQQYASQSQNVTCFCGCGAAIGTCRCTQSVPCSVQSQTEQNEDSNESPEDASTDE